MKRPVAIRNAHPHLLLQPRDVQGIIEVLDTHAGKFLGGCPPGELSLVFLTDPALAQIHDEFMHDPTITDVITFAGDPAAGLAGEICVSADMAARFVGLGFAGPRALQNKFSTELTLYVVHGWLHLAGYDDLQPAMKRHMRAAEKRAMILLRAAKAVPEFRLV